MRAAVARAGCGALGLAVACLLLVACTRNRDCPIDLAAERAGNGYSVYALRYALSRGVAKRRLVAGAAQDATTDMSWHFYVALGHGRIVLIDTGTDRFASVTDRRRADWSVTQARTVTQALAALAIEPRMVTDVLLTHHHWDHAGTLHRFTRANLHVQAEVWHKLEREAPKTTGRIKREGRLRRFDTERAEPLPGVEARVLGQHTQGHTCYLLACRGGARIAIAGDGAYLYENLERGVAIAQTRHREQNVADMQALARMALVQSVVPGHEQQVFTRYPQLAPGLARLCP